MSHLRPTSEFLAARDKRLGKVAKPAAKAAKSRQMAGKLDYPGMLCEQIRYAGLPVPVREYRFDAKRRWRFDLAWPAKLVAIEVNGGIWNQGRHTRGAGYLKDMEKTNSAILQGWRMLSVSPDMVKTGRALELVDWAKRYWL